jgi:hypothetical protein
MQRPQRQAAKDALLKIRSIREWENLSETSQRFIECAALIDAELEAEISKKTVSTCDLDLCETEEEESDDEYYDADDGFVVGDQHMVEADPDFRPCEDTEGRESQEELDDASEGASEQAWAGASEGASEEASEEASEGASEEASEGASEEASEEASEAESEAESEDEFEGNTEQVLPDTAAHPAQSTQHEQLEQLM